MILHGGQPLTFDYLTGQGAPVEPVAASTAAEQDLATLDQVVADHIRRALELCGGRIHGSGGAGERLGLNPNTLRSKMRKLGITFAKGRPS